MAETWLTIPEAAKLYGYHTVTLYKLVGELEEGRETKREGRTRLIAHSFMEAYHTSPRAKPWARQPRPALPAEAGDEQLREAIADRLQDLRLALEHERAIARSLADQNAQLVEQNRRLLEQVDDLTALTLRLGMGRRTQELG